MELDQQYITTGILLDKAVAVCNNIKDYSAVNDTLTNFIKWKSIYKSMRFGSFNSSTFITDDSIKSILKQNRESDVIPIFILNYNYNRFKHYILDSNLISTNNNRFFDVLERTESPYIDQVVFNASSTFKLTFSNSAKFVFNQDYYFTNDATQIDSLKCDFGDGNDFITVNWGDTIIINYGNLDTNTIILRMYFGTVLYESAFEFKMADICPDPETYPNDEIGNISGEIAYPFGSTDDDAKASAKYTITYGYTNGIQHTDLTKPLIFMPGLDPGYQDYVTTFDDCKYGMNGWVDLINDFSLNPAWGVLYDLEKGVEYPWEPEFDNAGEFFADLWNKGYDVIYFDYANGDDYMQRNAFALVEMIDYINDNKIEGADETVIIGVSMGGQITRYALTYMENENQNHCVRLFIAFDSGAKGSNLPLGLQHFGLFAYSVIPEDEPAFDAIEFQFNALLRPASEQLLVPHLQGTEPDKSHTERTVFLDELFGYDSDGYPDNLRKIAIANGNKTSTLQQGVSPGDIMIDLHQQIIPQDVTLFGITSTYYLGQVNSKAWYLPGDDFKFFEGSLNAFGISFIDYSLSTVEDFPQRDTAPGSKRTRLQFQLESSLELPGDSYFNVEDLFTFNPTISSLDINTTNLNFNIQDLINENGSSIYYPFEAYYAPESNNENHHEYTVDADPFDPEDDEGNIGWMLDQIIKSENNLQNLPATIEATLETTYNFGNLYRHTLYDVDINEDGLLQINGNFNTDYGMGDPAVATSTFTVKTTECNFSIININDGGIFEIGDDNTPTNNKGILELLSGSVLTINSGGLLKIHKNSKLYIRDGATVIIEPGSDFQILDYGEIIVDEGGLLLMNENELNLDGSHAKLILNGGGTIETATGVDFTFTGTGYLYYYEDGIFDLASGSRFILQGTGTSDRKLWLGTNAELYISYHTVELNDCRVDYNPGSTFKMSDNNVTFDHVYAYDALGTAGHAIHAHNTNDLFVNHTDFTGFNSTILLDDIDVCPSDVNVNIEYCTFVNHDFAAVEAYNVERMRFFTSTTTGQTGVVAGLFLEDVDECVVDNSTIKDYPLNSVDAAGIFAHRVSALIIDGSIIKNNYEGIEARATNIYVRNSAVIKNNTNGIYAMSSHNGSTAPDMLYRIVVGDQGCGWIINNAYGIKGEDMDLQIDQLIHAIDAGSFMIYPNRFDGNTSKVFDICYENFDADDLTIPISANHNYWTGGVAPSTANYDIGFDPTCDGIGLETPFVYSTQPTSCDCLYEDCETEPTEENIQARLASESCTYEINKNGGGRITIANQYTDGCVLFAAGEYNYAYQKFNWLKNRVESEYTGSNLLPDSSICKYQYLSSIGLKLLSDYLATAYCQYPFWINDKEFETDDIQPSKFIVYPNPTNTVITLLSLERLSANYQLLTLTGEEIKTGNFTESITFNMSEYSKGVYLVIFTDENSNIIEMQKIVLQ